MHFTLKFDKRWSSNILDMTIAGHALLQTPGFKPGPEVQKVQPRPASETYSSGFGIQACKEYMCQKMHHHSELSKLLINMAVTTRLLQALKKMYIVTCSFEPIEFSIEMS